MRNAPACAGPAQKPHSALDLPAAHVPCLPLLPACVLDRGIFPSCYVAYPVLDLKRGAPPISICLFCRLVDQMQALSPAVPSLIACKSLTVNGPVRFEEGVAIQGDVKLTNGAGGCILNCS
jgi:hypothetical protein